VLNSGTKPPQERFDNRRDTIVCATELYRDEEWSQEDPTGVPPPEEALLAGNALCPRRLPDDPQTTCAAASQGGEESSGQDIHVWRERAKQSPMHYFEPYRVINTRWQTYAGRTLHRQTETRNSQRSRGLLDNDYTCVPAPCVTGNALTHPSHPEDIPLARITRSTKNAPK